MLPGELLTFYLRFKNDGKLPMSDVVVVDNLTQRFEYVQAIVTMLWTFLSPVKREQALRALMAASDRANHQQTCRNGHPRTADNLRMVGPGRSWRACRACQRDKEQAYRERKLAAVLLEAT